LNAASGVVWHPENVVRLQIERRAAEKWVIPKMLANKEVAERNILANCAAAACGGHYQDQDRSSAPNQYSCTDFSHPSG
jgi:hypothetical protein